MRHWLLECSRYRLRANSGDEDDDALSFDAKAIEGIASFEHGIRLVVNIAKQNEGWLRSQPSAVQDRGRNRGARSQELSTLRTSVEVAEEGLVGRRESP